VTLNPPKSVAGVDSPFDWLYDLISRSHAYRQAIRASCPDLPEWIIPASVINLEDLRIIATVIAVEKGQSFADFGCGGGGPSLWVAENTEANVTGIDSSSVGIRLAHDLAKHRGMSERSHFIVADLADTGLTDGSLDGLMSIDALMFAQPRAIIAEMARVLKPGGIAAIRTVESLVEPFQPTLVRDYTPLFEECGFAVGTHEEIVGYHERSIAFFQAVYERSDSMLDEVGAAAAPLIEDARESMKNSHLLPRVRTVFVVAALSSNRR